MASDAMRAVAYLTTDEEGSPARLFFDELVAATYCDEGEEPQALVLQSDALKAIEEARVEAETLRKERDEARRAKTGHFSPFYLLANARRIQSAATARDPNWVLAMNLFAVGSTTAQAICRENGIDPDATVVRAAAAIARATTVPNEAKP